MKRFLYMASASCLLIWGCSGSSGSGGGPDAGDTQPPPGDTGTPPGDTGTPPGDTGTPPGDTTGTVDTSVPSGPADLRADFNRDGEVDLVGTSDEIGEESWGANGGAVFLANIDDDLEACPTSGTDKELPNCNDALDNVINGEIDLVDMARLHVLAWKNAGDGVYGTISVSAPGNDYVRFFKHFIPNNPIGWQEFTADATLSADDIRNGVELAIEGKDIVRDSDVWDGYVDITLDVYDGDALVGSDTVRMRIAPVMTFHHKLNAIKVYATEFFYPSSVAFRTDINKALAQAGMDPLVGLSVNDQWTQDFFETGYMSMPTKGGGQHVIHVNYRSANNYHTGNDDPLRPAGKVVFTVLRGKDSAGIQHYDPSSIGSMDSLNSFGNTETIPPYTYEGVEYPLGRLYRGSVKSFYPDKVFSKMLESQKQQPPVYVDTSWLLVGHVDETVSFIRADNEYGWTIAANDAALAIQMLDDLVAQGNGNAQMFIGKQWNGGADAKISVQGVLNDEAVMEDSAKAIAEVDAQVGILLQATGLTQADVVKVPFLHESMSGYSVAYQPGMVNGLSISQTHFAPPDPFGPKVGGVDVFKKQMEEAFGALGVNVHWVEDWDLYHILLGEVHCGTNATRQTPSYQWWRSGR